MQHPAAQHGLQCVQHLLLTLHAHGAGYLSCDEKVLSYIVTCGSNSATLSDAARAWIDIRLHLSQRTAASLPNLFLDTEVGRSERDALTAVLDERIKKGLIPHHHLALLLDPRPSMRAFVARHSLLGDGIDRGNTPALTKAVEALEQMSGVVKSVGPDGVQHNPERTKKVLKTQLLAYLGVRND